jgi:hypothetical protein
MILSIDMKQISLSTGTFLAVSLPEGTGMGEFFTRYLGLPPGQWSIIGTSKGIMRDSTKMAFICEMMSGPAPRFNGFENRIRAYKIYGSEFDNEWDESLEVSFSSLCQLHQIGEEEIWLKKEPSTK